MGYDPGTGRFISKDTWSGDYNNPITLVKWVYANENPLRYTDHNGKKPCIGYGDNCCIIKLPPQPSSGKLSAKGEAFIKAFELRRKWPYGDAGECKGNCTIGYGTVLKYPKIENCSFNKVQELRDFSVTDDLTSITKKMDPNRGLSEVDMQDYFNREITKDEIAINTSITIPLTQNQFDALVSYLYNAGQHKLTNYSFSDTTTYAMLINNHEDEEAFNVMIHQSSYIKGSNDIFRSLFFRRYEEREMYFNNDYAIDIEDDPEPTDFL